MFVRHVLVSITLVFVSAVPSYAGALLGCVRFPFQVTKHTDFVIALPLDSDGRLFHGARIAHRD